MRWFERLADVPGIDYQPFAAVDRERLPGHDARPLGSGLWPIPTGSAVSSPAWWWMMHHQGKSNSPTDVRQRMAEALELPGYLGDYASSIGMGAEALWRLRAHAGWVPAEVETLCWLQIQLAELVREDPEVRADQAHPVRLSGAEMLIDLYAREGYLNEAVEVAETIIQLGQPCPRVEGLRERMSRVRAEDDQ